MFEHYVYVYLNPLKKGDFKYGKFEFEYEPFYIGMGKKDRIDRHISYAISKMKVFNPLKNNIILKILKNGIEPIRYKLYENLSIETAKRIEKILIRLIGRRDIGFGTLANHTNGGDETPFYGKRHIEESIEKMRMTIGKSRKGKLNANFGNYWSDEQKNKASKKAKELGFLVGEKNPMLNVIIKTDFNFPGQNHKYIGKVRDVYTIKDKYLIMVATDRISAFDVVLPKGIPYKGQVLNQIASCFLDATAELQSKLNKETTHGCSP